MDSTIGLSSVRKAKAFILLSPVGPYYPRGFVPVNLLCDEKIIRAWPKGFGDKKLGGNYAPGIRTGRLAVQDHGCDQVLWLLHDYVTEVGTMNFFTFWKNEKGEDEVLTPPLDGTILPGVTRDSILSLCKEMKRFKVTERMIKIQELAEAIDQKRVSSTIYIQVYEAFGCGTAAIVSPVASLKWHGKKY